MSSIDDLDLSGLDDLLIDKPKTKGSKAKAPKTKTPFRELKTPPIRQPARGWAAIPPAGLARERYRAQVFETATYKPEHMLGQFPPIGLHGPSIHSL
jgi:hypothetical protein